MDSENTRGVEGVAYLNLGGLTCNAQRKREGREVWLSVIGNGWGWVGTHLTLDTQIWEVESRFAEVGWVWGFNLGWRGRVRCAAGNQADWYVDLGIHIRLEVSQSQGEGDKEKGGSCAGKVHSYSAKRNAEYKEIDWRMTHSSGLIRNSGAHSSRLNSTGRCSGAHGSGLFSGRAHSVSGKTGKSVLWAGM
ncbi:hypothetical protein L1987_35567 [Smallanthus sonchifolius]|uniref:Uncharacterized protein n=1 Tax=Smallanthus sonchifolius TaxID=185202 RepID=A0ACB9HCH0_9ASTR|nr:hypothetical protein L1987_35567 [Smallanthus sonchifolius]